MKSQGIIKVISIHPLENMNVCMPFHRNPSNSCRDISVRTKSENITREKSEWNYVPDTITQNVCQVNKLPE